jgi:indolepyruvate ferredoxin oxidoreductase beta subunit
VDIYLAFEKAEALRYLNQLRSGALALINLERIQPVTVTSGGQPYPSDDHLRHSIAQVTPTAFFIDAQGIANSLGNPKVANIALLGSLFALIRMDTSLGISLSEELWLSAIDAHVPKKAIELNHQAFKAGSEQATGKQPVS